MDLLNRGAFGKPLFEKTTLPNGDTCYLKVISGKEAAEWYAFIAEASKGEENRNLDVMVSLVLKALCDESGVRLFSDNDKAMLADIPNKRLFEIYNAALKLNILTEAAKEEVKKNNLPIA